jgi:putative PIN family toxin of toxin-antitoxin system
MRVLLDTNILVSYLLMPRDPIRLIVDAGIVGAYELLIPEELLDELAATISAKESLKTRIPGELLAGFIEELKQAAMVIPWMAEPIEPVTRDPKDDFLIACAVAGQADIIVSGDHDLLILGSAGELHFLSPADFARLLLQN